MSDEPVQRRLAAVIVADVVGYSRLMEADEAGTLAALKQRRRAILEPIVRSNRGRIVKLTGDGVLIEFPSAVRAVESAMEVQKQMEAANQGLSESEQILLRVGINLGDVIADGLDLYGDGVNVAARLESAADPGGILVSGKVYEETKGKVSAHFEDAGVRELKNIASPVRTFKVVQLAGSAKRAADPGRKPILAVLPFLSRGSDLEQEEIADGLTEDIITALSHSNSLHVIARTSVFAYKGKVTEITRIGQELDVDYLIEGSVRKIADAVRVTAQLIDARTGHHVWAEKYDGITQNVFDIQDQITKAIAASIGTQIFLSAWQSRRLSPHRDANAHQLALAAMGRMHDSTSEAFAEADAMAEQALRLDPNCYMALVVRCAALLNRMSENEVSHTDESVSLALQWGARAVQIAPLDENCRWVMAWALAEDDRPAEALAECERGLTINPNSTLLLGDYGSFNAILGKFDQAVEAASLALKLDPRHPANHWWEFALARAYFGLEKYELARDGARRVARRTKKFLRAGIIWVASAAALDDQEDVSVALRHCLSEAPDFYLRAIWPRYLNRYAHREHQLRLEMMLRKAGVPE